MDKIVKSPDPDYPIEIKLKNPPLAAFWAWLIPGAGHLYQKRYAKGILFMVCILGTFFSGLALGGGKTVYASFREGDQRYPYLCQVGVGLPALPAFIQYRRVIGPNPSEPLWGGFMAPPFPLQETPIMPDGSGRIYVSGTPYESLPTWHKKKLDPNWVPGGPFSHTVDDELSVWHADLKTNFELGTLYTMIAGLLNILAIYDAYAGPAFMPQEEPEEKSKAKDAPPPPKDAPKKAAESTVKN